MIVTIYPQQEWIRKIVCEYLSPIADQGYAGLFGSDSDTRVQATPIRFDILLLLRAPH